MLFFLATVLIGWLMMTVLPLLAGEQPVANVGLLTLWTIVSLVVWRIAGGRGWGLTSDASEAGPSAPVGARSSSSPSENKYEIPADWVHAIEGVGVDLLELQWVNVNYPYHDEQVLPQRVDLYRAFHLTSLSEVRVVILGQDPYPEPGIADGLAFSVRKGTSIPPSLSKIFAALRVDPDLDSKEAANGSLARWAKQGVLLLNSALTVEEHNPGSHLDRWRKFSLGVLRALNAQTNPIVFLTFGDPAAQLADQAELSAHHKVIKMAHPVAWSNTNLPKVVEAQPFSKANAFLARNGRGRVDW